jgi:CubicO group peptidase (beta-lactamase class C family)
MRSTTILTLTCLLGATNANAGCPAKMSGSLQQIVRKWVDDNQPGNVFGLCAVALDKNGNEGFACSGKADATHGLDKHTLFQIGSVTKTMTAALLARRVSEGSFNLSDLLNPHLGGDLLDPHLPSAYRRHANNPIRIQDLATHHSGLRKDAGEYLGAGHGLELLDDCLDATCLTTGNPYEYSNWAFQILGYTLAHEDGWGINNWFDSLYYNVLMPNEMEATKVYEWWQLLDASYFNAHAASSHVLGSHNQFVGTGNVPNQRCPTANPSGCLYSSPHDMRKWLEYTMGLRTPVEVLRTARHLLRKVFDTGDSPVHKMGLAWRFSFDPGTQCHAITGRRPRFYTRVAKSGDVDGQHAWIEFLQDPEHPNGVSPLGVIVMANSDPKGGMTVGALGEDLLSKIPLP